MKHFLIIDRGNTATKAAIYDDTGYIDICTDISPAAAVADVIAHTGVKPCRAIFSNVGSGGDDALSFVKGYTPEVKAVHGDMPLPIHIKEHHKTTLGADRIAAAVGAHAFFAGSPILVVDSGTAVTCDLITADGTFEGGNIAPGLRLSLDALHRHTALLPDIEVPRGKWSGLFGDDTPSAMICGAIYSIVGAIESLYRRLSPETKVVITGGSAPIFLDLIDAPCHYAPHLVLDGLFALVK